MVTCAIKLKLKLAEYNWSVTILSLLSYIYMIAFEVRERNPQFVLGRFFQDCIFVVDTHLPRFEALAYVLPHFDELTHVVIRASSAFIILAFAEI